MSRSRTYKVHIRNAARQFSVLPGETVLAAALRQDVELPWGCGSGICGTCMGQIITGELVYPAGSPLALFEEDEAQGKGLFCVGCPRSDLVLDIPEMGG